jgi:HAE1 family hydrophobic/amphiphilic exporter-1
MASIVETSIKKPLLILVVFTVLTLGGLFSYTMLNLNLLPSFETPMLTVQTVYPGAGAAEVETSVTKKLEDALSTLENLKKISSTSMEGLSMISVELSEGANADQAVQNAQRKINAIKSDLPTEVLDPSIDKFSFDEIPIMNIAVSASLPASEFYTLVENRIQPRLAKLQGVGSIQMTGGSEREIKVNIDADKLKSYNLSALQVLQAIQTANIEIPAGNVEDATTVYSVRMAAKFSNLNELRNTVITTTPTGGKVKIMDVAEIEDGIATQKIINRIDGRDAIGISVKKQSDANAVKVADLVKAEMASIEKEYESNQVKFDIATDDSVFTRASTNAIVVDLLLAVLIVSIVCFLFLHNIRSALMVMIAVPLSLIPTFIVIYIMGLSLNMMSLMALSLVVGIVVDDSIIVIENMFSHMEKGKPKRQAALEGAKQILFTCMATTMVLVVVFLPLAVTGGVIGGLLKEFAIPIIVSILFSLLVSYTVTPLLMSIFGKLPDDTRPTLSARFSRWIENIFKSLQTGYAKILAVALKHKIMVVSIAIILLIGSITLIPAGFIGTSFMPETDLSELTVELDMNPQVTVYQNNQLTLQVEEIIRNRPEVERIYTNVGQSSTSTKNNFTTIAVKLVGKDKRNESMDEMASIIKADIMQVAGVRARVTPKNLAGNDAQPIQFIVQGTDMDKVQETADMILAVVRKTPGTVDAKFSIDDPRQEVQVNIDREKMATLGLKISDVGSTLRVALNGNDDSKYNENDFEYRIRVGVDNFDRTKAEDVSKLTFLNKEGKLIQLSQFADISYGLGATALERTDRIPSIIVKSSVSGRPMGTVGSEISAAIDGNIPEGVTVSTGGQLSQQSDAFGSLAIAFLAAILLIYFIMVVLYDSLLDPIIIMLSIPLALIGALLALALTMNSLDIFTIIGMIVLIGLVAKNAIMLVDFTNQLKREQHLSTLDALIEAGKERFRPILMTAFSTIFGMLPIAIASGNGAELKNGMAWVVIGGMASSMLLTLVVVPVVYYAFDKMRERFSRSRKEETTIENAEPLAINQ